MAAKHLDIAELQVKLRRFAAERDWEQFCSRKDLAMALSVKASGLVELFGGSQNHNRPVWTPPPKQRLQKRSPTFRSLSCGWLIVWPSISQMCSMRSSA